MQIDNLKSRLESLSKQGSYQNKREIGLGGIPFTAREVLISAPLIAGLNVYLVGETGEGKTQLANDVVSLFGEENSCYAEGRPDFEPSEILRQLNLGNLRNVSSDRDLVELTQNVNKMFYYVDELNRCPPIVMNYFFNFFDGKLVHQGKVLRLGKDNYSVGYASGNIGDGSYVGISDTDRALRDRMHMIIKLDDPEISTTEQDDFEIFSGKKDPRATLPDKSKNSLEDITELHREFCKREVPIILPIIGEYFHKGLDYLEGTPRHSKRAVSSHWPNVHGIRQDTDESKIMPLSKRAVLATIGLSQALEMIAEIKGEKVTDNISIFLDALKLTVPYSGVFSPSYISQEKDGDVYAAFDDVMARIRQDINSKKKDIETAVALAQYGQKDDQVLKNIIQPGQLGKWAPVRRVIENLADNPNFKTEDLEVVKEKYKAVKPKK